MEKEQCSVQIEGEYFSYPKGTDYETIAKDYKEKYPEKYKNDIVLVFVDGRLQELFKKVKQDCTLYFLTTAEPIGLKTYKRSMCLMLVKSIYDVAGHDKVKKVRIHFAVSKGYYCTIEGDVVLNEEFLESVEARMRELVSQKMPIKKRDLHTQDAVALFNKHGMYDKGHLFEYRRVSKVNIYSMNEFEDYYYGYMVPDAGYLRYFSLYLYEGGFVIQMPEREDPEYVPPFVPHSQLFHVQNNSLKWGDQQGIETVGDLDDITTKGDIRELIMVQEAMQEKEIAKIAETIASRREIKFVLIAGPSSSGKTTFSHRLSIQLRTNGVIPHPIGVDDYFKNREDTPKDEDGNYNFECLEAIDVKKLNEDLTKLLNGEEVSLPTFNFKKGCREYNKKPLRLGEQDVLVLEGIHCLNNQLTYSLPNANKFKIYISALTQLNIDEHNRISTTDGRLIRRLVRDVRTRGISGRQTIAMWPSVRRGEEENIFPYQEEADIMFNSALIYELAVLKQYAEPILFGVEKDSVEYLEAKRLLKFLDYFVGVGSEAIPMNSLLREFIGGSCFQV